MCSQKLSALPCGNTLVNSCRRWLRESFPLGHSDLKWWHLVFFVGFLLGRSPEGTKPEEYSFLIKSGSFEAKLEVLLLEAFPCGCAGLVGWFRLRQRVWLWQRFRFRLILWAVDCMVTKI